MVVKGTAKLKKIMYPKGNYETSGGFTIASFEPINIEEGEIEVNPQFNTFSIKGEMPPLREGEEYYFIVEEGERHPKFGLGYDLTFMRQDVSLDESDESSIRRFLEIILTDKQIDALYDVFDNPLAVIESGDIDKMTEAKGIGNKTAQRIINHYESQKDYSLAYIELGKYQISPSTIRKVVAYYGSPELAIQKVLENPYNLMKIDGYGFKKCDKIFLQLGGKPNAEIRVRSFLVFALQEEASKGHTWTSPQDIFQFTQTYIPNVDKNLIGSILLNDDEFYLSDDRMKISLTSYKVLEEKLAKEILRINNSESEFVYDDHEEIVHETEVHQGWCFSRQQKDAMSMMLENNISVLQGYGGTGKTTTLKAVVDILEGAGYTYAQCALSGKASNNLTLVTKKDGSTIHRLLGLNPQTGSFYYNKKTPLPYDIVIIDEFSMVDGVLFYHLMSAVRDGAKLIIIGDSQQLESIGVPVMIPMLDSGIIPTITLTEIHRQALKSATVTDSIAIREGRQVVKESIGRVVHGELQDLEYELVENDDDIFFKTIREFHKHVILEDENIMDVQILTQQREKGKSSCLVLNNACQKIYNPPAEHKEEHFIGKVTKKVVDGVEVEEKNGYYLRKGDKVINVKNNYTSVDEFGVLSPVFNGSIGIIEEFAEDDEGDKYMLIDFEGIGRIRIYTDGYKSIELGYCITVHKSQGSSCKVVIIALPFHYTLNTRQLLYTAITRTRKHCVLVSTKKTISSCIKKDDVNSKRTYLASYLIDIESA